jgi:hypothetical protein
MEHLGGLGDGYPLILSYLSDEELGAYAAVLRRHGVPFRYGNGEVRFRPARLGPRLLEDLTDAIARHAAFAPAWDGPARHPLGSPLGGAGLVRPLDPFGHALVPADATAGPG